MPKNEDNMPIHVAIIPDGNRRWASEKGLEPWLGHETGASNMESLARKAFDLGIKHLSFWGSSLENLSRRPLREKQELLKIYEKYFNKLITSEDIVKNDTRINIIGRWREQLPGRLVKIFERGIVETKERKRSTLNFFLAYSGDDEMVEAVRQIVRSGSSFKEINKQIIKNNLMTRDLPPVDLLIRTGGEPHLSAGFMMWDIADSQLYFSEKYFPDFKEKEFTEAIDEYLRRERRHGK